MKKLIFALFCLLIKMSGFSQTTPNYGNITATINGIALKGQLIESSLRPMGWYKMSTDKVFLDNIKKRKEAMAKNPIWGEDCEVSLLFLMSDSSKITLFADWNKLFGHTPATVAITVPAFDIYYKAKNGKQYAKGRFSFGGGKMTTGSFTLSAHDATKKKISGQFSAVIPNKAGDITIKNLAFSNMCYLAGTAYCKD